MTDKIKIEEVFSDSFAGFMLLAAITHIAPLSGKKRAEGERIIATAKESGYLNVSFIVEGKEIPVLPLFKRIEEERDRSAAKKALELAQERCGNVNERIDDFGRELEKLIKKQFPEFPDPDEDY